MIQPEYSQGICGEGAAILKDGQPMTVEEIVAELRGKAQPSAEPVAWMQSEHSYDPERHGMQRRLSWKKLESDDAPLYAHPPTDSAALRDALKKAQSVLENTQGDINPVRGYAEELEEDITAALTHIREAIA